MSVIAAESISALRPETRGARTRERAMDAAEQLFAERGFEGTTLRDVAGAVGIRIPSLYNHFDSKESLYAAVLERGMGPVLELLTGLVRRADALDARRVVAEVMALLAERPNLPHLVLHETLAGGARLTPVLRAYIAPIFARAGEAARRAPAAEHWGQDRIGLLVLAMYHIVVGYFTIAPLYRELNGQDLLAPAALERQTALLADVVDALFTRPPAR